MSALNGNDGIYSRDDLLVNADVTSTRDQDGHFAPNAGEVLKAAAQGKPKLLFVTPFVPLSQGRGSAMRAAANLEALCEIFSVTLALINPDSGELEQMSPRARNCAAVVVTHHKSAFDQLMSRLPGWRLKHMLQMIWPEAAAMARVRGAVRQLADSIDFSEFDVVHCFRLQTAPLAGLAARKKDRPHLFLDLDDYESRARLRGLKERSRSPFIAAAQLIEAIKYWLAEARHIPRFKQVHVCSSLDKATLTCRFPAVVWSVIPNVVALPPAAAPQPHGCFTFLFVGTLDYSPNKDAVIFFCRQVLPLLRKTAGAPFRVKIVGRNPDEMVLELANGTDVEVFPNPPDVAPFYREADACIAPVRAGGGTRIKILEAFSYKLPVISTTIGAEGLDVEPSVSAEIADSAEEFAKACARILADPERRARLSAAGHALYQARFSPAMLALLFRRVHRTDAPLLIST